MTPNEDTARSVAAAPENLTPRAIVLGFALVIAFCIAGCFSVLLRYEIIGTGYLPRGAIFILLLLVLANAVFRRLSRARGLRRGELLTIFALLLAVAAIPGQEFSQHFYLNLLGLIYFSGPGSQQADLFAPHIKPWLAPSTNPTSLVITKAFEGMPAGMAVPFGQWLVPLLVWTPFFFLMYWTIVCCAALLSRQWEDHHRLLFPLVQVPVELADSDFRRGSLLRNPAMWICFWFSAGLYIVKGLHTYFPIVPDILLQKTSETVFPGGGPMSAWNDLPLHFYPEMVGISFLLSTEVSFSIWFFFLLRHIEQMMRIDLGIITPHNDCFMYQTVGGYIVLGSALLWSMRSYLKEIWLAATGIGAARERDAMHPKVMLFGAILGYGGLVVWSVIAGMSPVWPILMFGALPLVSMVVSRVVCEAGMFIYTSPFRINEVLFDMAGPQRIGARNLTLLTMASWTQIRSTATMNMPAILQSYKLGSSANLNRRQLSAAMMAAIAIAIIICHVTSIYVIYHFGIGKLGWWPRGAPQGTASRLASYIQTPRPITSGDWWSVLCGGAFTAFLVIMRQQFLWWPFHPLGFVAWMGWPTDRYWLSILIGWMLKASVMRWGGYQLYRQLRPAAFGLILGICTVLTFWLVLHFFWPGPELLIE